MQDESYTRPESYTLSFTGNPQYTKGFSRIGVGNVGEKQKTFFGGVGFGNAKHRTSLRQTSVLLRQNIGTLPQRSPMFLNAGFVTVRYNKEKKHLQCHFASAAGA